MVKAFMVIGRAVVLWWREFVILIFFNIVWLILQVPIVTGPPATAAMYVIAIRVVDEDIIDLRTGWDALMNMFIPAIKWGAINFLVVITLLVNFWIYQDFTGTGWVILRLAWGTIGLGWFSINLFYWPFWLFQDDSSMGITMKNSFLILAKRPLFSLTIAFISALLIVGSVLTTLPMTAVLMSWLALIGVLAVNDELKGV
jgi:hypothetical protein